ncbi:unnamed protein product [Leptosia nina]|uniref:BRCT domain-containing protein n=1 Tax=Leptosia nina TaxID=320188 RepID=A0AAV1IXH9_9NEOP
MTEDIIVTFIIPKNVKNENDCSEEMKLAYTACEQHSGGGIQAQFVHETKWKKFDGLTKKDVFVLSEFSGELFERLRLTKCLLVGPRCLSCCLTEGSPIPSGPDPVYTIAMRGLVITASGLFKQQKKVQWMGGIYSTVLTEETTHLVSDTVLSEKYIKSVEKGIPVMSESWVEAVWESSLTQNINGSSSEFDFHRLPPFINLQVTTSGITKREKLTIVKLVNEHGGTFSGAFQSESTDVVVLTKEGVGSEKYKAALEYGKACVLPAWVIDSAAKGVALPLHKYKVTGASTSSPLAEHRLPDMSLNFSRITNLRPPSNFVDESRAVDITLSSRMKLSQEQKKNDTSMDKDLVEAYEKFDMRTIKKAGPIFDGFCIWLVGLEGVCRERATACVSRCGGVRYDSPHERVTHSVAGSLAAAASANAALPTVPVLSARWLLASVEAGRALDESEFLMNTKAPTPKKSRKAAVEPASPMSKRNLQLLHEPLNLPPPEPEPEPDPMHDDLVNHYLSQNVPEPKEKTPEPAVEVPVPEITEDMGDDPTEEIEQIFRGLKIEVQGLEDDAISEIGAEISAAGGLLVARGGGDEGAYRLVPLDWDCDERNVEYITVFWIKDCLCQQELVPLQYYHRPVSIPSNSGGGPLEGVVASLSTYSGLERAFLDEVAKLLGATTQLRFCRRNTANAQASTHLICPTPTGDKYLGALKWGLPAVTADWLLACLAEGKRVSEKPYLIGDTKAPPTPEKSDLTENEEESEIDVQEVMQGERDKENEMLPPADSVVPRRGSTQRDETPKTKPNDGEDMSPASRYIAMARQGLLGCDSQETPKRQELQDQDEKECAVRTPPLDDALSTPNLANLSPTTRRRLQAVRRGEMPSDPVKTPADPFARNIATPDSGFGAALRPGSGRLSPENRKRLWKIVNDLPSKQDVQTTDRQQTPLSEIRNRFLAQFNGNTSTPPSDHTATVPRKLHLQDEVETPPPKMAKIALHQSAGSANVTSDSNGSGSSKKSIPAAVDAQLQRLSAALSNRLSSQRSKRSRDSVSLAAPPAAEIEAGPESQPNTVGWDDTTPQPAAKPTPEIKRFMLSSNVDNREEITEMIVHLGGEICEGAELDPRATHLLCSLPGRSEKMLCSVAGGKWVLHPAYVARSRAAGKFLSEEDFEWGNPLAQCLPTLSGAEQNLARAAYRWRSALSRGSPGPFHGIVGLLHVPAARRRLLARLLEAGGGVAPDAEPPYTEENITVCFADIKRYPLSERDSKWLVSRRIPVCAPVLLSSFLTEENPPDPKEHCLPEFRLS